VKKVRFMDTSFRDGFQSVYGARVLTQDFCLQLRPLLKREFYTWKLEVVRGSNLSSFTVMNQHFI